MLVFMEKFKDNVTIWYDSLNEKERRLLLVMSISIFSFIIIGSIAFANITLNNKNNSLIKNHKTLSEIVSLQNDYIEAKKKHEQAINNINKNRVSLFSIIPAIASSLNLNLSDLSEKTKPVPKTKIIEVYVNLNLRKLSIDRLIALIEAIEEEDDEDQIKITKLNIKKSFDETDLLDVQMTISTWKSA